MPFTIAADPHTRTINVKGSGAGTLDDVLDTVQRVVAEARKHPDYAIIADNRQLDYEPPVTDVVEISRALFEHRHMRERTMAVVVKRGIQEQLGRVFAAMGNYFGMRVDIFTDLDDAIAWLRSTHTPSA